MVISHCEIAMRLIYCLSEFRWTIMDVSDQWQLELRQLEAVRVAGRGRHPGHRGQHRGGQPVRRRHGDQGRGGGGGQLRPQLLRQAIILDSRQTHYRSPAYWAITDCHTCDPDSSIKWSGARTWCRTPWDTSITGVQTSYLSLTRPGHHPHPQPGPQSWSGRDSVNIPRCYSGARDSQDPINTESQRNTVTREEMERSESWSQLSLVTVTGPGNVVSWGHVTHLVTPNGPAWVSSSARISCGRKIGDHHHPTFPSLSLLKPQVKYRSFLKL